MKVILIFIERQIYHIYYHQLNFCMNISTVKNLEYFSFFFLIFCRISQLEI